LECAGQILQIIIIINMMNKKLLIIIFSIVGAIILIVLGILFYPRIVKIFNPQSKEPISLNIWGMYENPEVIKSVSSKYVTQNPNVTINYDDRSVLSPSEYKERVFSRLTSESDFDIVLLHNTWIKEMSFLLSPIPKDIYTTEDYSNNFYNVAKESALVNNSLYAVPAFYDGLVLVYNKDHFEEVGQLEPPSTWEEFRRLAVDLTITGSNGSIIRSGAAIGNSNNIKFATDIVGLLLSQTNVKIPDNLDSRASQEALLFYTNFVKQYKVWDNSFIDATSAFAEGQVSMIFVPSWNILDIISAKPNLNIGVAKVPQAKTQEPVSWGSFWMYAVPQSSLNKQKAWEFIKFMSQPEQQQLISENATKFREFASPYALKSMVNLVSENQFVKPVLDSASYSVSSIISSRSGNLVQENSIRDIINNILQSSDINLEAELRSAKSIIQRSSLNNQNR